MLIDTGADITVLPRAVATRLGLIKFSEIGVAGFRLAPEALDTFLVSLKIHQWGIEAVEIVIGDDNYGVLGRDVLNRFVIVLYGPDLALTIESPSSKST